MSALSVAFARIGGIPITAGMLLVAMVVIAALLLMANRMLRLARHDEDEQQISGGQIDALLRAQIDMQARLSVMTETMAARQAELGQTLNQRMDNMGQRIGQSLGEQTRSTHENLRGLQERLATIDAAQNNIQTLARDVVGLQAILSNKQTRGAFGQGRMEAIIMDALPNGSYSFQPVLSNGLRPDCTISMPGNAPPLVIDAKFPLESWNAMRADASQETRRVASQQFRRDMDVHIRDVAEKYLLSGETQDTAFMFVPSESIFADIHQYFEAVVQKAQRARVVIVSPSLLMLSVQVIQSILRDQRMREEAHLIQGEVALLMDDLGRLDDRTRKLQSHFLAAQKDVDMIITSSDKLAKRGTRISEMDFSSEKPKQEAAIATTDNRRSLLRFRVVDEE